jgi:hypothetical protein
MGAAGDPHHWFGCQGLRPFCEQFLPNSSVKSNSTLISFFAKNVTKASNEPVEKGQLWVPGANGVLENEHGGETVSFNVYNSQSAEIPPNRTAWPRNPLHA